MYFDKYFKSAILNSSSRNQTISKKLRVSMREGNVSRMADYEIPTLPLPPK